MNIEVRQPNLPLEYEPLAELVSIANQATVTAAALQEEEQHIPSQSSIRYSATGLLEGFARERVVAVNDRNEVVGFALGWRAPFAPGGQIASLLAVRPDAQKHGIGEKLLQYLEGWAISIRASVLMTVVPDSLPASLAFAENRGFIIDRHLFHSTLDLGKPGHSRVEPVKPTGDIVIQDASLVIQTHTLQEIYDFYVSAEQDIPGILHVTQFSEWEQEFTQTPAQFILFALRGSQIVGVTHVSPRPDARECENFFTGVSPDCRGLGIAYALKLRVIEVAQSHGYERMVTDNDSKNIPMLRINEKLGYVASTGGHFRVYKNL